MSVFIDTGVFYAHQNKSANKHEEAKEVLSLAMSGELGQPYTSDYIYDEAVTLTLSRTGNFDEAMKIGKRILHEEIELLFVDKSVFESSIDSLRKYRDQGISFTDATTISLIQQIGIDTLLSFNADFDGIIDRLPDE